MNTAADTAIIPTSFITKENSLAKHNALPGCFI